MAEEQRLYTTGWDDYELIDAGGGKKLERWGYNYYNSSRSPSLF